MSQRTCTVSCEDENGNRHSLDVKADSLYDAIAQALVAFKSDGWVGEIAKGRTMTVRVQQPAIEHHVRIADFEKWLDSNAKSPAEMLLKRRIGSIVNGPIRGKS